MFTLDDLLWAGIEVMSKRDDHGISKVAVVNGMVQIDYRSGIRLVADHSIDGTKIFWAQGIEGESCDLIEETSLDTFKNVVRLAGKGVVVDV